MGKYDFYETLQAEHDFAIFDQLTNLVRTFTK